MKFFPASGKAALGLLRPHHHDGAARQACLAAAGQSAARSSVIRDQRHCGVEVAAPRRSDEQTSSLAGLPEFAVMISIAENLRRRFWPRIQTASNSAVAIKPAAGTRLVAMCPEEPCPKQSIREALSAGRSLFGENRATGSPSQVSGSWCRISRPELPHLIGAAADHQGQGRGHAIRLHPDTGPPAASFADALAAAKPRRSGKSVALFPAGQCT